MSISFPTPNNDDFCHSKSITFRVNEEQSSVGVPTMTLKLTTSTRGVLRYCRNVRPTWVKFNSKDTKESERWFEFKEY